MSKEKAIRNGDLISIVGATDDSPIREEHSHASVGFKFGRRGFCYGSGLSMLFGWCTAAYSAL